MKQNMEILKIARVDKAKVFPDPSQKKPFNPMVVEWHDTQIAI